MQHKRRMLFQRGAFIAILLCAFAVVVFMNYYTPLTVDDYCYHTNLATGTLLTDFSSILESMRYHYRAINGRLIPHFLVQCMALYLEKGIFNIINASVFTALGFLIYKISNLDRPLSPIRLLFIYLLLFTFAPAFGQTVLWFDGSVNYLWGVTLILLMLFFFQNKLIHPEKYKSIGFLIGSLPIAVLAGGWSENASAVFLMMECLYAFCYWQQHKKVPAFYIADFLVSTASWLLMITAPANTYRRTLVTQFNSTKEMIISRMSDCMWIMRKYLYVFLFMLLALLVVGLLIQLFPKNRFTEKISWQPDKFRLITAFIFFLSSFTANFIMIAAPYGPRSAFGPVVFLMISVCLTASCFKFKKNSLICSGVGIILFVCMGALVFSGMQSVQEYGIAMQACENEILEKTEAGEINITANTVRSGSVFASNTGLELLSQDPTHYLNEGMAAYYEVDSIVVDQVQFIDARKVERIKNQIFDWLFI